MPARCSATSDHGLLSATCTARRRGFGFIAMAARTTRRSLVPFRHPLGRRRVKRCLAAARSMHGVRPQGSDALASELGWLRRRLPAVPGLIDYSAFCLALIHLPLI